MPVISIISAIGCFSNQIVNELSRTMNYNIINDEMIINETSDTYKISQSKIHKLIYNTTPVLFLTNNYKNIIITSFKIIILKHLLEGNFIYSGFGALLMPSNISKILKVCLGADSKTRIKNYSEESHLPVSQALKEVKKNDKAFLQWTQFISNKLPSDPSLYDIIFSLNTHSTDDIVNKIFDMASKEFLFKIRDSKSIINDAILAESVKLLMLKMNHDVGIEAVNGNVKIFIKKYKLRMESYSEKLKHLASTIDGVKEVEVTFSKEIEIPSPIATLRFERQEKILLVDDEIEFVDALSERLSTRNFKTSVAYSGEEALERLTKEVSDVMILDLKMPGIDGIEVLRRVKAEHPGTEVIILTGHGSDKEKQIALELGAFAYLEKPVDINILSETMKNAYAKINLSKSS